MEDRRKYPRKKVEFEAELHIDSRVVKGTVQNMSEGGVLIALDEDQDAIAPDDVCKNLDLIIQSFFSTSRVIKGNIVRIEAVGEQQRLGIEFSS